MMKIRTLGEAFDYKTEAARRSHNSDWTYVLVTFGPSGVNAETIPFGNRELLEEAYNEAVADESIAYAAAFDKTEDDLIPVLQALDDGPLPVRIVTNAKSVAKGYGKWIVGAVLVGAGLLAAGTIRKKLSKTTPPSAMNGLAGYRVSVRHRKLKGSQSLCIEAPSKELAIEWAKGMTRGAKSTRVVGRCGRR